MKRRNFIRHLEKNNCVLKREGGSHSVFMHQQTKKLSTVPRHNEINDFLAIKICKDLGIPKP